jgi:hypothetical protein
LRWLVADVGAEASVEALDVASHDRDGEVELVGDLLVGEAAGQAGEYAQLGWCVLAAARGCAAALNRGLDGSEALGDHTRVGVGVDELACRGRAGAGTAAVALR